MPKMSKTVVASLLVIAIQAPPHAQLSNQSNGDNGPATGATVVPLAVRVDAAGNIYIVDNQNGRVRKVTAGSGIIETVAGSTRGIGGDGGPAKAAQLQTPKDLVIDSAGNLYIADLNGNQIRKVTTDGIISTFARTPNPVGLAMDSSGTLYISQLGNRVVKIAPGTRTAVNIAGDGTRGFGGDGGPATLAQLNAGSGGTIAVAPDGGAIYILDTGNQRVRKIASDGLIRSIAGDGTAGFAGDGGPSTEATLNGPTGIAVGPEGELYIADSRNNRIRAITADGIIRTIAGNGRYGFSGDGGPATSAMLNQPTGVALDSMKNIYIADYSNGRIRKITADGLIRTVAGSSPPPGVAGGIAVPVRP